LTDLPSAPPSPPYALGPHTADYAAHAPQWVGTERGTYGPFLHPPRCHRACDFHRTRRPPARIFTLVSFCRHRLYSQPYHSPGSYFEAPRTLWPFALYAAFPRADYYGHADSLQTRPGFSEVVSNPLLPLPLSSSEESPMFPLLDSNKIT
jgi:hypothetical protein